MGKPRPARGDSGRGPVDSVESYEKLQADTRTRVPVAPQLGAEGPIPASARIVFTRDSIDWAGALTLSDLLARVPGTYLLRAGGIGRPEPLNFAARGAASLEVMLDGMPYRPLGPDSVGVDPADIPLGVIDRVEIERWPSTLRVYLYTRNHDRLASRVPRAIAGPRSPRVVARPWWSSFTGYGVRVARTVLASVPAERASREDIGQDGPEQQDAERGGDRSPVPERGRERVGEGPDR